MSLIDVLRDVKDHRGGGKESSFNGYLEDYLNTENAQHQELFGKILEVDPSVRVMVDFSVFINRDVIANRVMGYKDIYKIPKWYIKTSYVLYSEGDKGPFALILCDRNYYESKGLLFSLTEKDAFFEPFRKRILVMSLHDATQIPSQFELLAKEGVAATTLQREQDRRYFKTIQELQGNIIALNTQILNATRESLETFPTGRSKRIHDVIASWYLLKKMMYVSYMMDRNVLEQEHNNDIKEHRRVAKEVSAKIEIIPFSEMWR